MFKRCNINTGRDKGSGGRRGNTIVMVVGILVLLVIIATSYVTRTHAGRVTAVSQLGASLRDDNARVIAESIAGEIAGALFVRPVDLTGLPAGSQVRDSNVARLSPRPLDRAGDGPPFDYFPVRYGVDPRDANGDGRPDHPWNFAPYQVVPFTNWPDFAAGTLVWPEGPGNPNPVTVLALEPEGNPLGFPGFGDSRWLADTEPVRERIGSGLNGTLGDYDDVWIFTHWRHMTNLSRAGNGWRICRDISDVGNLSTWGGIVGDLNIPVEQFLSLRTDALDLTTRLPSLVNVAQFEARWRIWFRSLVDYNDAYLDLTQIPPNFLHLRNLNGNADVNGEIVQEVGERPQDEFIVGTARWNAGRYLADADGDGFTDSFWSLAPTMTERGIRKVVAVRIVDNGAMLNVNVGGRFIPRDEVGFPPARTRGITPADLALVGQLSADPDPDPPLNWNTGLYDNRDHQYPPEDQVGYLLTDPLALWNRHLDAVGLLQYTPVPDQFFRNDYWRRQGIRPLGADPRALYTPFGIPDEIELRMFHGNNYPWIFSRLEGTTEISAFESNMGPLRGSPYERGSSEYLEQLPNRILLLDSRRKLTTYNGARNDIMPPWLWPHLFPADRDISGAIDTAEVTQYFADMRKYDLRQPIFDLANVVLPDVDGDGLIGVVDEPNLFVDDDLDEDGFVTKRDHLLRIRDYLDSALIVRDPIMPADDQSYFGTGETATHQSEKMAAAMAANIDAYRDQDSLAPLAEAVEVVDQPGFPVGTVRYLGLEAQPFLVEAVVAHVHELHIAQFDHPADPPFAPAIGIFNHVLRYQTGDPNCDQQTIVVVQIANPFDIPVNLGDYRLSVFGQDLDLEPLQLAEDLWLDPGRARTYFSMSINGLDGWKEALDIDLIGTAAAPLGFRRPQDVVDVTGSLSQTRDLYDDDAVANGAIELSRRDSDQINTWILVDRIDIRDKNDSTSTNDQNCRYRSFGRAVTQFDLGTNLPQPVRFDALCNEPVGGVEWYRVSVYPTLYTHWAQWARVSRPWVLDLVNGEENEDDLKNPRYVIARTFVDKRSTDTNTGLPFSDPSDLADIFGDGTTTIAHFASKDKHLCEGVFAPDGGGTDDININDKLEFAMQMLQKDADFEQVGELLNVWLFGHELSMQAGSPDVYNETMRTFSESLSEEVFDAFPDATQEQRRRVNRLQVEPVMNGALEAGAVVGLEPLPANTVDFRHAIPDLPAGARVIEAFVCDGYGLDELFDLDLDGDIDLQDAELRRLKNANEFTGRMTPGLININTATQEVMRSLPQMARLVGLGVTDSETGEQGLVQFTPRVHVAEAAVGYRDRIGPLPGAPLPHLIPDYTSREREGITAGLRVGRGFASIGEMLLLTEETDDPLMATDPMSWRIDFAAEDPFVLTPIQSTRISTDVVDVPPDSTQPPEYPPIPDEVAGDSEEANLLFAGMSNMITTRSDVFTVYFKIRSFTQNPVTGRWDATDPEHIVDDSRYVMLVDRSEVNHPYDKPKIVYLEKLPK